MKSVLYMVETNKNGGWFGNCNKLWWVFLSFFGNRLGVVQHSYVILLGLSFGRVHWTTHNQDTCLDVSRSFLIHYSETKSILTIFLSYIKLSFMWLCEDCLMKSSLSYKRKSFLAKKIYYLFCSTNWSFHIKVKGRFQCEQIVK